MKTIATLIAAVLRPGACRLQHHSRPRPGHPESRRQDRRQGLAASDAEIHRTQGPRRPDGPRERRHRRDHPQAVPQVDPQDRLRPEPVRRVALPGPRRARPGPGQPQAQPGLRAEPAALQGRLHPAGAQELRLRLVARARALGARPVRLSRHHRAELRRHLLQQLLQERPAADRAARVRRSRSCSTKSRPSPATSSRSTWSARSSSRPQGEELAFDVQPSASTA